eukprot:CFRG5187T1
MEEECPALVATSGSSPELALKPPRLHVKTKENKDGTIAFSKLEWLIDVEKLSQSVDVPTLVNMVFPPLQRCRCPVSVYGKSVASGRWTKLPDVILHNDLDFSLLQEGNDDEYTGESEDEDMDMGHMEEMIESFKRTRGIESGEEEECGRKKSKTDWRDPNKSADSNSESEGEMTEDQKVFAQQLLQQWTAKGGDLGEGMDESSDEDVEDLDMYSDLVFGVWLLSDGTKTENQIEQLDETTLQNCLEVITKAVANLGPKHISTRESVQAGANQAASANLFVPACDDEIFFLLKPVNNTPAFKITQSELYDTLYSLGLTYTEGQFVCFTDVIEADGGEDTDCIFSVDVNLNDDREMVAPPDQKCESIKLGFYLPHNIAPREVVQLMAKTVEYMSERFNGEISMDQHVGANAIAEVYARVDRLCNVMEKDLGIFPGTMDAHFLYN